MYNISDLIARYIPLIESIKLESRKWLMIVVLSRFLFIPTFYYTAKYGDQGWMIMLISLLGVQMGPEANALGNILVLFLLGGIFLGVALDWLWIIGNVVVFLSYISLGCGSCFSLWRPKLYIDGYFC
ncbi:putative equilibrative nucleoside transporter [Helianthus annuus]|nr:putative equilibrative nucleoside transporter [Helianthus annuus]